MWISTCASDFCFHSFDVILMRGKRLSTTLQVVNFVICRFHVCQMATTAVIMHLIARSVCSTNIYSWNKMY